MITVSVRMADKSTMAMESGISMPVWRNCSVTMVAVEPMGRFRNRMGLAVEMSAMRWWSMTSTTSAFSMPGAAWAISLWSTRITCCFTSSPSRSTGFTLSMSTGSGILLRSSIQALSTGRGPRRAGTYSTPASPSRAASAFFRCAYPTAAEMESLSGLRWPTTRILADMSAPFCTCSNLRFWGSIPLPRASGDGLW